MASSSLQSKWLLAAVALTLLALAVRTHLPERRLALTPATKHADFFLLPQSSASSPSKIAWIDRERLRFACDVAPGDHQASCVFQYVLDGAKGRRGVDLSRFDRLRLKLSYSGTARYVRVAIRNFDPRFSKEENGNSSKFNNMNLLPRDMGQTLELKLSEFTVPEWWTATFDVPREYARPDFGNATILSVDPVSGLEGARHEVGIDQLEFVGEWISPERWYLGIICAWLLAAAGYAIARLINLQRQWQRQRRKIQSLVATNLELQSEKDRFRRLSTVDALTNAFNRHGIELIIDSLDMATTVVSLVLVDLDHFKAVNDRRGHDAGDRVLQKMAELLVHNTRTPGKVGRWGGEEFLIICPGTAAHGAVELANRLRGLIAATTFEPTDPLVVTASFGVAMLHAGERFADAFKRADTALYRAKSLGRNQVASAEPVDAGRPTRPDGRPWTEQGS